MTPHVTILLPASLAVRRHSLEGLLRIVGVRWPLLAVASFSPAEHFVGSVQEAVAPTVGSGRYLPEKRRPRSGGGTRISGRFGIFNRRRHWRRGRGCYRGTHGLRLLDRLSWLDSVLWPREGGILRQVSLRKSILQGGMSLMLKLHAADKVPVHGVRYHIVVRRGASPGGGLIELRVSLNVRSRS